MLAYYNQPVPELESPHYQDLSHLPLDLDYNSFPFTTEKTISPSLIRNPLMPTQASQLHNQTAQIPSEKESRVQQQQKQRQMLAQSALLGNTWGSSDNGLLRPSPISQNGASSRKLGGRYHDRRSSAASSIASVGPPSPQDPSSVYPHIAGEMSSQSPSNFDLFDLFATTTRSQVQPKSLPTPVSTPVNNFTSPEPPTFSSPQDVQNNTTTMRRLQLDGRVPLDDDVASYQYSGPQSVSSISQHGSPATPQTTYEENLEDAMKNLQQQGFNPQLSMPPNMPQISYDDYYHNQLHHLSTPQQPQQQQAPRSGGLSPYRSLANRFHAAQLDHMSSRTSSPTSVQREKSPFAPSSNLNPNVVPTQRLAPPQMTPAQYQQNAAILAQQQAAQQQVEQPKTVSPKDVELEYHGEDQGNLFPSSQGQESHFSLPREESSSNFSATSGFGQPNQFYAPAPSSQQSQYSFLSQRRTPQGNVPRHGDQSIPDFPSHLTSMETTRSSDSGHDGSTPMLQPTRAPPARPPNVSSDAGAYTCTSRGCLQRFDNAAKLAKHRRDAHPRDSPLSASASPATSLASTSTANHGHTSSAATIALRNAQAGPHKCERINPTTGKPCNSIFSRPYDLTRHEDTIHNNRKQKVRCHLCTEEKTFSRNDALTRHMRVVHPEVDWPGKQRKRGMRA